VAGFPSGDLVTAAAGLLPGFCAEKRAGKRLLRYRVTVTPGTVEVHVGGWDGPSADTATRGRISGWSAKSRASLMRKVAALDWAPMFALGPAVMVTLTYPGRDGGGVDRWREFAPDAAVSSGHLKAFGQAYRREFGLPLRGVWKREFQRRGAPHFHILMPRPESLAGNGFSAHDFRLWVASTWNRIVFGSGCPLCWGDCSCGLASNHLAVGLREENVSEREGARMVDPRRVAHYFLKHGTGSSKEYQHCVPESWESSGRFWGVWGLVEATSPAVEVCEHDFEELRGQVLADDVEEGREIQASMVGEHGWWRCYNDAPAFLARAWAVVEARRSCDCYVNGSPGPRRLWPGRGQIELPPVAA
jgi:hypothetical protein